MMTLEEAIKLLKQYQGYEPMFPDGETLKHAFDLTDETVDTLLTALRPVSREQVEKVWRGEWKIVEYEFFTCTRCGDSYYNGAESTEQAESYLNSGHVYDFCPHCGSANTEKAVQMVMERLEALYEDNS